MESPIKLNEEIRKVEEIKKKVEIPDVTKNQAKSTDFAIKMVAVFVVVLAIVGISFVYFAGNSIEEVQNISVNKNKNAQSSKQDDISTFKRQPVDTISYTNRGYGFQLTMGANRANYKTSVKTTPEGPQSAILNLYFPTSNKNLEDPAMSGYEKIVGIHIYTKKGWQDYQDSCTKNNNCQDIKIGENDTYVFAKPKDNGHTSEEGNKIADSLKTASINSSDNSNSGLKENDGITNGNSNYYKSAESDGSNSNMNGNGNSNTNSVQNPIRKENCSYPKGNIATWWSTASDREKRCYVIEHGEPDFGNNEPYFCDYANSDDCLVTR